mgnify:CR=1 FL=1
MPHVSSAPSSTWGMSREVPALFLRSYRGTRPRFASGTLMSLQEDTGTSALSLQTAQRDGIILARIIPSLFVCV